MLHTKNIEFMRVDSAVILLVFWFSSKIHKTQFYHLERLFALSKKIIKIVYIIVDLMGIYILLDIFHSRLVVQLELLNSAYCAHFIFTLLIYH